MKFFRHYKDKPYKYIGTAKHSETLDDVVIYECRYPNDTAKLWVRPKKMFFESVEVNGRSTPRFAEVPIEIKVSEHVGPSEIEIIAPLIEKSFGDWDANWFNSTFRSHTNYCLAIAYVDDKAVGFKLGYELDNWEFYSWLGGVVPEYQGLGVALDLMNTQHEWCRKKGYKKIQTKTQNRFKAMLLLNLKAGFEIIGTHLSDAGGMKIVLEKKL